MASKKIAVMGTQFSGKTTLIKNLSSYLKGRGYSVCVVTEVVRDCPYPVNEIASVEAQDWVLEEQKRREKQLEGMCDMILTDRCLLDNFAYWRRAAEKASLPEGEILKKERDVFEYSKKNYTIMFLQPFNIEKIEDDKFRSMDLEWREEMHERILDIVKKFSEESDTPVFYVEGDEREMLEQSIKYVSRFLAK
jgi:nicotinamide riboside kinase